MEEAPNLARRYRQGTEKTGNIYNQPKRPSKEMCHLLNEGHYLF